MEKVVKTGGQYLGFISPNSTSWKVFLIFHQYFNVLHCNCCQPLQEKDEFESVPQEAAQKCKFPWCTSLRGIDFYCWRPLPKALLIKEEWELGKAVSVWLWLLNSLKLEVCHLDLKLSNHVHSPPFPYGNQAGKALNLKWSTCCL